MILEAYLRHETKRLIPIQSYILSNPIISYISYPVPSYVHPIPSCPISHPIQSRHIIYISLSYLTRSYHIIYPILSQTLHLSYFILVYPVLSYPIMPCPLLIYHILYPIPSYFINPILSCCILYPIIPYPIQIYHSLYPILPILSYPVLLYFTGISYTILSYHTICYPNLS